MPQDQPKQNGDTPERAKRLWALPAISVASLASLTSLALMSASRGEVSAAIIENLTLVLAQAVTFVACLIAVTALLRGHDRVLATTEDAKSETGQDAKDAPLSDDPLQDKHWLSLVEATVNLLEELERHRPYANLTTSDLAEHVDLRMQEILERSGVTVFAGDTTFDRNRHQPVPPAAHARPGTLVIETLRPGLAVGRRVFRRARVRLANDGAMKLDNSPSGKTGPTS